MATTRPWRDIRAEAINTPEREHAVDIEKARLHLAETITAALSRVRTERGATQADIAQQLGVTTTNISRIEHEPDLKLSTLAGYALALGGTVEVVIRFDDETYSLLDAAKGRQPA
jgi:DNA-binding XRE family transcriptional regulator